MNSTATTDSAPKNESEPKRSRLWWLLLPLLAAAAVALALLPRPPDGLDFIRKYHPSAEVLKTKSFAVGTRTGTIEEVTWHRQFKFSTIPPELIAEIDRKSSGVPPITSHTMSYLNVNQFTWNTDSGTVYVQLGKPPPWLLQNGMRSRRRFWADKAP